MYVYDLACFLYQFINHASALFYPYVDKIQLFLYFYLKFSDGRNFIFQEKCLTNMSLLEVQAFQQNLGASKLFTKYQNHAEYTFLVITSHTLKIAFDFFKKRSADSNSSSKIILLLKF